MKRPSPERGNAWPSTVEGIFRHVIRTSEVADDRGWAVDVAGDLTREGGLDRLDRSLSRVLEEKPELVTVRVRDVDVIDLEGIGALLKARRKAMVARSRFVVVDGQPAVRRRLEVAGVLALLEESSEPAE
jgi:anti-anti-sigma regulatory factor